MNWNTQMQPHEHKDEESRFVRGQHEPIISEALFYQVQDVLDGRGRRYRLKVMAADSLPLRGFLICPKCGKLLSGSASKGRNKYYAYYHCFGDCTHRFRADRVNLIFEKEIRSSRDYRIRTNNITIEISSVNSPKFFVKQAFTMGI